MYSTITKERYHLVCSGEVQLRLEAQGRVDERHGFFWLDSLAPMDPQVPALPRTSQHLRGKRKRDFHSTDMTHRPHYLAEVQTTGLDVVEPPQMLEVDRSPTGTGEALS